jgi:gamma-glutamyltranspeptidase/glutathione hydrolase
MALSMESLSSDRSPALKERPARGLTGLIGLLFLAGLLAGLLSGGALEASPPPAEGPRPPAPLAYPLRFREAAVVSESILASRAGAEVLERGGNAVDAAVATAFALAVTLPLAGNIGGGGFLVARLPDGRSTSFDFREKAPLASTPRMFLDQEGRYDPARHHAGILSVGVPGSVAGLHLAHQKLGKLPWREVVEPAVALARKGFPLSRGLARSIAGALPSMRKYPASIAQFSKGGEPLPEGELLVQPDLARTLERIRDGGPAGFYSGETAELLVKEMERQGGLLTREDLARYRAVERRPIEASYRGYQVLSMPPPSSGGVGLLEMLNILEGFDLRAMGFRSAAESHLLIEAMRRAYADRARFLGDQDRVEVPVARLISKDHAASQRKTIDPARASRSSPESFEWPAEGAETTHLSVVDRDLLAVSLTTTLEEAFGSRIVVPGAGFLLNNEMGDFNPAAGLTDREGLIGTPPNLVEPEKRMLSSMTPTIVARDGKPFLVLGSPGGRTIINTVLEIVVNVIDHRMAIQDAVDAPRFHHQWLPDTVSAEPWCFSPETRKALEALGHRIELAGYPQGTAMALLVLPPEGPGKRPALEAGVDRRRPDTGAAGK